MDILPKTADKPLGKQIQYILPASNLILKLR
jgi:hypothetical protein